MIRSLLWVSLLGSGVVWADASKPSPADAWIQRCTKALEAAREETARRKLPVRDDPVSQDSKDGDVRLSLIFDTEGPFLFAGAILSKTESPPQPWTDVSDAQWPLHWRRRLGRVSLEFYVSGPREASDAYDKIFRPALERCLEPKHQKK